MTDGFSDKFMESFSKDSGDLAQRQEVAWQKQQAIAEYNTKVLADLLKENSGRPVRVSRVNVVGAGNNYRDSFLKRQLQPLLDNNDGLTLEGFLQNADLTTTNFTKTGTVRNIGLTVAQPQYKSASYPADTMEIVANLTIDPVKKFFMKVGTNVGNGEGDGYLTAQWKNIFGGGEVLNFDTNLTSNRIGTKSRSQYLVSYTTPINNSPDFKYDAIAYHSSRNIDYTSYHEQVATGLTNRFSTNYYPDEAKWNHEVSFENLVRTISMAKSPGNWRGNSLVNDYFLLNAGTMPKSSLTYTLKWDSRDSTLLPRTGQYLKLCSELSILPGSRFMKTALESTSAYAVNEDSWVNLNIRGGLISKLCGDPVHPMDKFQLGGPNDLRGFLLSGMGPKQMGMSTGGDAYYAVGLSAFGPIPQARDSNFKLHGFVNTGKLINVSKDTNLAKELTSEVDMSVGFGVLYAHPVARFELNYVLPVAAHRGEELRTGLQWGLGLSFL